MHITNIGGSLTTAVCLSLIAWSIRVLRAQQKADQNRSNRGGARAGGPGGAYLPSLRHRRAYARLSPTAFWLLTDSKSVKCFIVDVRSAEEVRAAESSGSGDDASLGAVAVSSIAGGDSCSSLDVWSWSFTAIAA